MQDPDFALMQSVLVGDSHDDIVDAEARMRRAQLAGDAIALEELISEDLVFAGPDGELASKAQDLAAHKKGIVRFREHQPEELHIRAIGQDAGIASLRVRLAVEVAGTLSAGVYRYTRVWIREHGQWRVAGGHVSEVKQQ